MVRVYCGLAAASSASWLTVAVVDDAGRLLDVRDISDDPAGYAQLSILLAERSGTPAQSAVAADRMNHVVMRLLAVAQRPLAIADERAVADFAERFADDDSLDERESPAERRAVGLARALQAGAVSATGHAPPADLEAFKPVLAAHAAMIAGRQAAAIALREVLRELYPAALRAYPDPAEPVPLAVLEAMPDPRLVTNPPRPEQHIIADICRANGVDGHAVQEAAAALRVAVGELPPRAPQRVLGTVAGQTVRHAVAAVRACDAAATCLIGVLIERLGRTTSTPPPTRPRLVSVAPISAAPATRRPMQPVSAAPASPANGGSGQYVQQPAPGYGPPRMPAPVAPAAAAGPSHRGPVPPGPRAHPGDAPIPRQAPRDVPPRAMPAPEQDRTDQYATVGSGRVAPPWLADDLPTAPASLRLADATPLPTLRLADPLNDPLGPDPFEGLRYDPPVPRTANGDGDRERNRRPARNGSARPEPDGDLLIFSQTRTAWFTDEEQLSQLPEPNWGRLADDGWRAAEQATTRPAVGADTGAGLPRRVPAANLVPGSPLPPARSLPIVRDPESIAEHTTGYFRGWRRGQEVGGFAVGQRDRGAWEFNRERAREAAMDHRGRRL
jgi:hypothetical protein